MRKAIEEYWDARIRLIKSFRKLNYRIKKYHAEEQYNSYIPIKKSIMLKLRKMDKLLRGIPK